MNLKHHCLIGRNDLKIFPACDIRNPAGWHTDMRHPIPESKIRQYANTLTTAKCSVVENTPFTGATTGPHCSQVAWLLPELTMKSLPDIPADGRSIYSGRRPHGPGAIEATRLDRRRIGITLSGTNSLIHPGELNESEYRCRPTAVRRDKRDNRASTRSVRRARNRDSATREAGTASRASPRPFRLPQ
ncbi:MAG: hypothetical protein ACN6QT_33760 [Burkholderia contaminans]|uniref:Uncharacterized protein n=1 Tax=Burkholderia contaminans TaxID=488447 RepID=A0AAP4QZT9_9BURK|nr:MULTISPECIES: hypothetical protein [Burkholderia]MBD1416657.1 hypothetical protein [Burkholderia contaminans]MBH9665757.1 hypothetical protein [Burkholderia contaminans]MBH9674693.1 hypothetical protein [Burkholderia contaminans]MBH9704739.1 hypothetical protein [Burkholderia contaminans]MBH9718762.1 hypothetical protein [Burkholderia contaminans]